MEQGWVEAKKGMECQLTIVNTCTVTQRAAHQSRQAISKAVREKPAGGKVVVTGCYAQVCPEEVASIAGVDMVVGNREKARLPEIVSEPLKDRAPVVLVGDIQDQVNMEPMPVRRFFDRSRAFLKIQDGCDSFCTYCIVPYARGRPRSLTPKEVLAMLGTLQEEGYGEVVLTGIHLGKYGWDKGGAHGLLQLLKLIKTSDLRLRIRLSSLEPGEITEGLIEMVAGEDWLCPHFHIPLQSGDPGVLQRMGRHYSPEEFAALVVRIREKMPLAAIGVDVMAGFPGEDEQAFSNTRSLVEALPISYLHVFPFSPRRGTKASRLPGQLSPQTIKERAAQLRELGLRKKRAFYESAVGHTFVALTETRPPERPGFMRGFTENYLDALFPLEKGREGQILKIRIEGVEDGMALAQVLRSG